MTRTTLIFIILLVTSSIAFALIFWHHGVSSYEYLEYAGTKRSYIIHIPPSYDGGKPVPLVIVLHGLGGTARNMELTTGMYEKSDAEGFIVVYPEGVVNSWNAILPTGYAFENNVDDVGFIKELIDRLQSKFAIDGNRIYVVGFSNGAMMAYRLAAELSDRIAAVAAVAGAIGCRATPDSPLNTIREPAHPVSVIIIHGLKDYGAPYNGGRGYHSYIFLSMNDSVMFWVRHNGCSDIAQMEVDSSGGTIRYAYGGGTDGTEVVLYVLINGEHSWPVPFATDEAWKFFESHPKG